MAVVDIFLAFPALVLLIAIVAFLGSDLQNVVIGISLVSIPAFARISRATTLTFSQREFVLAAEAAGASRWRILVREILPNVILPLMAFGLLVVGIAIVAEGSLAFLGLSACRHHQLGRHDRRRPSRAPAGADRPPRPAPGPLDVPHRAVGELPRRPLPGRLRRQGRRTLSDAPRTARRVLTAPPAHEGPLLVVDDFRTHFDTPGGMVKAVDGVTFSLDRGKTLGVVGESGSGKTVLARSLMGLLTARNVVRHRLGHLRRAGARRGQQQPRCGRCGAPRWPWSSRIR